MLILKDKEVNIKVDGKERRDLGIKYIFKNNIKF